MDPITAFLQQVLPAAGYKVLAIPHANGRGFRHATFKTSNGLADSAGEHSLTADVYFALAGYRQRVVETRMPDGTIKRRLRIGENVEALRALWLDIDCDKTDPAKGYPSKREGATALVEAARTLLLPAPLIVDSGGGYHAYWPLTEDVSPGDWLRLATMLKALCRATGLRADPSRTADMASVLRVPGTTNHKRGGKRPVAIVRGQAVAKTPAEMEEILRLACERLGVDPTVATPKPRVVAGQPDANADLSSNLFDNAPADPRPIIAGCQQMRRIATQQEDIDEPLWYAALQVVRHCEGGNRVAHAISRRHPGYSQQATETKLAHLIERNVGPTLCTTFEARHYGGCNGCVHQGKIASPIQLGKRGPAPAPQPVVQVGPVVVALPEPPEPYVRTKKGQIAIVLKDEDGVAMPPEIVYPYDLYPVRRIFDEFTGKTRTVFRTTLPIRGEFEFEIDNETLYDGRTLPKALANADLLPSPAKVKVLGDYMVSYTQRLQQTVEAARLYMQMGWREGDRFIIGHRLISPGETARDIGVSSATALAAEKLVSAGSLDDWKQVVSVYSRPGWEPYLFGFATAFGAPLFGFTNYNGAIINMVSKPGTGKSTILKAMNSVYGHPEALMFSKEDTTRSVYRRIGVYNSLPIAFDEITNIAPEELSDLAYNFSQGRERMRLTAAATERRDAYNWKTIMAATSNASLHDKLGALKADASAETVRIFEYRMPDVGPMDPIEAKHLFDRLYENYGLAGEVYLQYVADNMAFVKETLKRMTELVFRKAGAPSSERFWIAIIAANLTGLSIAQRAGLITFDAKRTLDWALEQLATMRGAVTESTNNPVDSIALFLNSHVRDTLVVDTSSNNLGTSSILRKPSGELICRLELDTGTMFVDRSTLKKWCSQKNVGYSWLRKELTNRFVLLDTNRRKCLGAGTDFATAQTACWVLDMTTSHMGEIKVALSRGDIVELKGKTA